MTQEKEEEFPITEYSFVYFKSFCKKWITELGLIDWNIDIVLSSSNSRYAPMVIGNRACVLYNYEGRRATMIINKTWEVEPTPLELNRCALHECAELLVAGLVKLAENSFACSVVEIETHKIIRVLENILIPDPDK